MNCAFEDCLVLDELLDKHEGDLPSVLSTYEENRKIDTDAIADLAEDNFYEMRDATADPVFNRKRRLELKMEQLYPDYYSKYSLVTFQPDLPYHKAMERGRAQDRWLMQLCTENKDIEHWSLDIIWNMYNEKFNVKF
jgi:kynurenine 3-monooxygenase